MEKIAVFTCIWTEALLKLYYYKHLYFPTCNTKTKRFNIYPFALGFIIEKLFRFKVFKCYNMVNIVECVTEEMYEAFI